MFFPNIHMAGQVPVPEGNFARITIRPYLKTSLEFKRAEVYCFVTPCSVYSSFLATIFKIPLLT